MMPFSELVTTVPSSHDDQLRLAAAVYLARFTGSSRSHTESDCAAISSGAASGMNPPAARRPHLELYVRWMP
jgi:integrase/recombinase XerD